VERPDTLLVETFVDGCLGEARAVTGLEARESPEEFHRAIRLTVLVIAAFAGVVALGLLLIGPFVMTAVLGNKGFAYGRYGLAMVGLGMGLHLISGTLNQAALAQFASYEQPAATAGFSGASRMFSCFTRAEARAISAARAAVASTAPRPNSADAANPHAPSAIARTLMPTDSASDALPTFPFFVVSARLRCATTRTSA